ncbi:MAG: sigma-54-dependent Fis family transcriptional regulator [Desulfobacteraceae bacterium 4484_190.2]|nr:MAG: sigma-54-dependent Fis family transcriptional regulator [Desulfobacteraceae bacterium 4484_190.2]
MLEEEYSKYWQTVVHTMLDGLMVVDPDGIILSINDAMEQLTGYHKDELIGQSCEILDCDTCFGTRARGGDRHCELFKDGQVRHSKCVLKKKDGSPLHVLKNAAILRDKDEVVVGGVETLADCTELVAKERVISSLRRELSIEDSFQGIIGKSTAMRQVFDLIKSAASSEAPAIIYGESGTGKELVAIALHSLGTRSNGPFITVNCAALNESLLESELFGHVKGAFTGADHTRVGRFEAASNGDIFLDEIGDLPISTQIKMLRVLQEKEIEKVGDHHPVAIDVRVLAATNKDLKRLMEEGRFRDDLYYRIGVIPIYLPPLRERREDIPLLVDTFINRIRIKSRKQISGMNKETLELLMGYDWPGNVRELINVIEYTFVLCNGEEITPDHLPGTLTGGPQPLSVKQPNARSQSGGNGKERLLGVLKRTGGNKSKAARILGISRVTLWKRLKAYDIQVDKSIQG